MIDKPVGPTSFDVVARLRRAARQRRIGHGGTLDPIASGVLPVFLGRATRLARFSSDAGKEYRATIRLGVETTTYDSEGETVAVADASHVSRSTVEAALDGFKGEIDQQPPMYSAIQIGGQRLYELARKGQEVARPVRRVTIHEIRLIGFQPPDLVIDVVCSKGTYIRSLAHDLGSALGLGAHLSGLRRTRSGAFTVDQAVPLEAVERTFEAGAGAALLLSADAVVVDLPRLSLDQPDVVRFQHGQRVGQPAPKGATARVYGPDQAFLGLAVERDGHWKPDIVFGARES